MSRTKCNISQTNRHMSRTNRLRPLAGLLAMGLTAPAFANPSVPFPTYVTGPQPDGSWVVGNGQVINPKGIQVGLGNRVRAKAIALNPNPASHTAAVLTMGQAVEVFDTRNGAILQNYSPLSPTPQDPKNVDSSGSYGGITYSAGGKYLLFSQGSSNVTIANVLPPEQGSTLTDYAHVSVRPDNSFITCFPNSPQGDYGRSCGTFYTTNTSYPGGVAISQDGKSAYALLNQNNTLAMIDVTKMPPTTSATATCGTRRRSSSRKTTRRTALTTSTATAAPATSSARTRCSTGRPTTPTTPRST
jgi:hypothetical protein